MITLTPQESLDRLRSHPELFLTNGTSLVSIRTPRVAGDLCGYMIVESGKLVRAGLFPGRTVPSTGYLVNPINSKGCLILRPQWRKDAYALGEHKGRKAFVQVHTLKAWRDDNNNALIDTLVSVDSDYFGANIHDMPPSWDGDEKALNEKAGAGCQIYLNSSDLAKACYEGRASGQKYFGFNLVIEMFTVGD